MKFTEKVRWLFRFKALNDAVEKEGHMYDIKIGARKALKDFLITSAAIAGSALASYYAVPEHLAEVLGFLPSQIQTASIAIISPALVFFLNWLNNRK